MELCKTHVIERGGWSVVGGHLDDESTVFAATDVHSRLTLKARLAKNQNTNKIKAILAISETEAT